VLVMSSEISKSDDFLIKEGHKMMPLDHALSKQSLQIHHDVETAIS
jgi:hypothetical protein